MILIQTLLKSLKETFPPEFRNRFTGIYQFKKLGENEISRIIDKEIASLNDRLSENNNIAFLTDRARKIIIEKTMQENNGGRPVERLINSYIVEKLVDLILFDNLSDSKTIFDDICGEIKLSSIEKIDLNDKENIEIKTNQFQIYGEKNG